MGKPPRVNAFNIGRGPRPVNSPEPGFGLDLGSDQDSALPLVGTAGMVGRAWVGASIDRLMMMS